MSARLRLGWAAVAFALVAAIALRARAAGDPRLQWWTIETAHFRIHYERNLEPVALRLARLSESIHARLTGPLGHTPTERTEVLLTDYTELANGSATAVPYNNVRLFVTAPADLSALGDYDDWYLGLLTHEYTHVLHVDNLSGLPAVVNAILGKTLLPNQLQPRWFIEGLAVVSESAFSSGGRIRSSLFDMFLRADVIDDNFARIDQISAPAQRWPHATMWYLYGSRFMQWIADEYGMDTLRAVATDYGASVVPFGVNRAIRRQTGRTYEQLYVGFEDHLRRRYARQLKSVRAHGLREGRRLTFHGRSVHYPSLLPRRAGEGDGYRLRYYRDDEHHRRGIYQLALGSRAAGHRPPEQLVARSNGSGPVTFTPTGAMLFSSIVPYGQPYRFFDLFSLPKGARAPGGSERSRRRLTSGLRATAPTVSPSGRQLAFTVNGAGTTTLKIAALSASGEISGVRTLVASRPFDQVFTPAFSADGQKLAYSAWTAGGMRDLRLVDVRSGSVEALTHDRALDMNPCWSSDGRSVYFSSDRTGIFNIYRIDVATRRVEQVTNVRGGALMPTVSEDGKLLVYVGYTSAGYDLFAMPLDPNRFTPASPARGRRPTPYPEPPPVPYHKHRYNPLSTLRPRNFSFELAEGNYGGEQVTFSTEGADIAGFHSLRATVVADPSAPLPQASLNYAYRRLPFDLSTQLSFRVTRRSDYRFNDLQPEYTEKSYSIRNGLSYADRGEFGTQRFGISHTASVLDSKLPVGEVGALDPYADPTVDPLRGFLSVAHVSYSYSNTESSADTVGPVRGTSLRLGLDYADEATGSQQSLYSGSFSVAAYAPMPWPGKHVLAMRSSGGLSKGTFSRRGTFSVGGYNLENTSTLDLLTSSAFNGAFVLRGYEPFAFRGSAYLLENLEYRIPIAVIDRGPSTLPFYLRRIDGNLFLDYGGAFDDIGYENIDLFSEGALVAANTMHTGAGFELWLGAALAHVVALQLRLGFAYGFSSQRVPGGQWYFLASNAF